MRVFVSYSHKQGAWVTDRLVPYLQAGGVDILIDKERFKIGKGVVGQMDSLQDQAEKHILILSPDYLGNPYRLHEMRRALKLNPKFERETISRMDGKTSHTGERNRPVAGGVNPIF